MYKHFNGQERQERQDDGMVMEVHVTCISIAIVYLISPEP